MPGITKEQQVAFIKKYSNAFDEEVLVDQGAFKGLKVKDADRAMVENFGQKTCVEWLLGLIEDTNHEEDIQKAFSEFYDDSKFTFLAIRHHFSCEGSVIIERYAGKNLPGVTTRDVLKRYSELHGYCW